MQRQESFCIWAGRQTPAWLLLPVTENSKKEREGEIEKVCACMYACSCFFIIIFIFCIAFLYSCHDQNAVSLLFNGSVIRHDLICLKYLYAWLHFKCKISTQFWHQNWQLGFPVLLTELQHVCSLWQGCWCGRGTPTRTHFYLLSKGSLKQC